MLKGALLISYNQGKERYLHLPHVERLRFKLPDKCVVHHFKIGDRHEFFFYPWKYTKPPDWTREDVPDGKLSNLDSEIEEKYHGINHYALVNHNFTDIVIAKRANEVVVTFPPTLSIRAACKQFVVFSSLLSVIFLFSRWWPRFDSC